MTTSIGAACLIRMGSCRRASIMGAFLTSPAGILLLLALPSPHAAGAPAREDSEEGQQHASINALTEGPRGEPGVLFSRDRKHPSLSSVLRSIQSHS